MRQFALHSRATIAEIDTALLARLACLVPQYRPPSPYPAIDQDLNLVMDERVRWTDLEKTIRGAAGQSLEQVNYRETYRDAEKDGPAKKRLLFSFTLRATDRTLTSQEADAIRESILAPATSSMGPCC